MGKPDQGAAAAEGARRATGDAAGNGRGGRFSARRKRETVLRRLRGEDLLIPYLLLVGNPRLIGKGWEVWAKRGA